MREGRRDEWMEGGRKRRVKGRGEDRGTEGWR